MTTTSGTVRGREASIPLLIADSEGVPQRYRAAVDTGYTGYLALPRSAIQQLCLAKRGERPLVLADGRTRMQSIYAASVLWLGEQRSVRVFEMGDKPLVGMRMLAGSRVTMDVIDGGPVTIEPFAT